MPDPCKHRTEHRRWYPDFSRCRVCGEAWPVDEERERSVKDLETLMIAHMHEVTRALTSIMLRIEALERRK